jgi:hypothetical protein
LAGFKNPRIYAAGSMPARGATAVPPGAGGALSRGVCGRGVPGGAPGAGLPAGVARAAGCCARGGSTRWAPRARELRRAGHVCCRAPVPVAEYTRARDSTCGRGALHTICAGAAYPELPRGLSVEAIRVAE